MKTRSAETATIEEEVDSRITYPYYKSFDEFVDVERLKSLNGYITERIKKHIKEEKDDYFLNAHRLEVGSLDKSGSREIWLTRTKTGVPYDYLDLDKPELWQSTEAASEFSLLIDFIKTLPFRETGRMLII